MNCRKCVFVFMLLGITTTLCVAQTWNATSDFAAQDPNGAWSYGYGVTGTSFTLYPTYNDNCAEIWGVGGFVCWSAEEYENVPLVGFNTTGNWLDFITVVAPPNILIMHPAPNWEPADSIVQWTAPAAGNYRISGFFEICDIERTNPTIGLVYRNGTQLYSGTITGPPAQEPDQCGGRENFYFPSLALNAGDVISFGVNADGNFYYGSTGFNAVIVTPPSAPACEICSQSGNPPQ